MVRIARSKIYFHTIWQPRNILSAPLWQLRPYSSFSCSFCFRCCRKADGRRSYISNTSVVNKNKK